jgi:hypothetical protein
MVMVSLGKAAATAVTSTGVSKEHAERAAADATTGADEGSWLTALLWPPEEAGCPGMPGECAAPVVPQPAARMTSSANPAADRMSVTGISDPL